MGCTPGKPFLNIPLCPSRKYILSAFMGDWIAGGSTSCLCMFMPRSSMCYPFWGATISVTVYMLFFACSHELKQCNRGYRLQIILGTDCFIHPRNLKGALYSRDAWTFSNQPWMILRISRHSEHENLTQSRLQPQGISRQPFKAQDLWNQLSSRSELMTPDDGWIMLHP